MEKEVDVDIDVVPKKDFFRREINVLSWGKFALLVLGILGCSFLVYFYSENRDKILGVLVASASVFVFSLVVLFLGRNRVVIFNSLICSISCLVASLHILALSYMWGKAVLGLSDETALIFLVGYFVAIPILVKWGIYELNVAKQGVVRKANLKAESLAGCLVALLFLLAKIFKFESLAMGIGFYGLSICALFGSWGLIKVVFVIKYLKKRERDKEVI